MREIGHYSGNHRLDVSKLEEPDQDTEKVKKRWLSGNREIKIRRKLRLWNEQISPTTDPNSLMIHIVGQSHIDCAWMWRYEQTRKKAKVTFQKAVTHSKMFPETFCFAISQPLLLEWIKKDEPELFKEIQKFVKKGNIELVGGCYVEPDCMMPSGEAMIRQRLYGMRFCWKNFNQVPEGEWFLDSFGYNFGLPQILVKSGANYFWTTKMGWNLDTTFPFVNFWWQGADGSKILTGQFHMDFSVFYTWQKFQVGRHLLKPEGRKVWNYELDYSNLKNHVQEEICPHVGYFFGKSDGGHGPTHKEVAYANEFAKLKNYKWSKVKDFFNELKKSSDQFPIWMDELYLETHRGCFSNHANVKRFNRKFENKLISLELLASITSILNSDYKFPQEKFEELWKIVLKNQFHDVLPGSSIPEVFDDCYDDWLYLEEKTGDIFKEAAIGLNLKEYNEIKNQLFYDFLIFNPHTWGGNFRVFFPNSLINADEKYKVAKVKSLKNNEEFYCQRSKTDPKELEDKVPEGWWSVLHLPPLSIIPVRFTLLDDLNLDKSGLEISEKKLSNSKLSIEINPQNGAILKIISAQINDGNNLLDGNASNLTFGFLDDNNNDPAWNLTPEYWKYPLNFANDKDVEINIIDNGPVFVTLEIKKLIGISQVVQKIRLFKDIPEIFFEYYTNWKQKKVMLKILYSTSTNAAIVCADGMYCSINSKTDPEVPCDKARYEKHCQEYFDLSTSDNSWGIAMINEGKYAFDVDHGNMRLTLLRSCKYPPPAPEAWVNEERKWNEEEFTHQVPEFSGLGPFICRYAILPHNGGTLKKGDGTPNPLVRQKSLEFNMPVSIIPLNASTKKTSLNIEKFIDMYPTNVFLGAIKHNEWIGNHSIVVRFYEAMGIATDVEVNFNPLLRKIIKSIKPIDLIERDTIFMYNWNKDGKLNFRLNKFEICSFEISLDN